MDFEVKGDIPKVTTDDGITLDPSYEMDKVAPKDLEPINWMEKEETNIHKVSQLAVDRILKWLSLRLKQPRVKASRKKDSRSEPASSIETRQYKKVKKIVATIEEPAPTKEKNSMKQVTKALKKAKVTYQVVASGVISGLGATPIATMYLGKKTTKECPTMPLETKDTPPTTPLTMEKIVVQEEGAPTNDVTESPVLSNSEKTPLHEEKSEREEYIER